MSDLLAILAQGAASLSAARAAAATASHNLQNANTPGYARQDAVIAATIPADWSGNGYIGRGSVLQDVVQARDQFLEAQIPAQLGLASRSTAQSTSLQAVSVLDPQGGAGLSDALSKFYAALRAMAQNPSDPGLRTAVVSSTRALGQAFQSARSGLEDARTGLDAKLQGDLGEVNSLASQVAALNAQIRTARAGTGSQPNDLLDARQKAVDRLAELTGVSPVTTSEGDVSLFLPGGSPMVSGLSASTLQAAPDPANTGHLALSLQGPGGAKFAYTGVGGELGGVLDARDGAMRTAVDRLDALAFDLGNAVNAVHSTGFGLDGTTGDPLFTVGAQAGAAGRLDVSAAVLADPRRLAAADVALTATSAAPGNAVNWQKLVTTESTGLTGGLTAASTLASLTSDFGAASQTAQALASHDTAMRDHLTTLRESVSGVSIDEEMVKLQTAQRGYQAIAKVIQTSSDMFDTLLSLKPT
jgi:flagellar hook-associated protein 1